MSGLPLVKIRAVTADEVCAHFLVNKETRALLGKGTAPGPFLEALLANKQYIAGIDFLAHALPPREAIWWGCLCFQHACGPAPSEPDRPAITAAVLWVLQPNDSNRTAAKAPGETAGPTSVAGALAMAAYQTGPGIPSGGRPAVAQPPFSSAKSVVNAIKLACTKCDPAKIVETQRLFVELGVGVAAGRFM